MLEKSAGIRADELVLDLEDAVVAGEKARARDAVVAFLAEHADQAPRIAVRTNQPRSAWCHLDLIALASSSVPPASVIVPKVDEPEDVGFVERLLDGVRAELGGPPIGIQALVESARGLEVVGRIARSSRSLIGLIVGYADLGAELKRRPHSPNAQGPEWDPVRHQILLGARAAGLQAIDGPYLGLELDADFRAAVARARELGFDGKWAIHPKQLPVIEAAFKPTDEELERARRVLQALALSEREDHAGATATSGEMLDEAVRRWAVEILAESDRVQS
jgi:citrate lyase subunit beta / citryl-CoA lyase